MGLFDTFKQLFASAPKQKKLTKIDVTKHYELRGKSGLGSMSKVYPAIDRKTGKMVHVKILDKEKSQKFEERFAGLKKPSEGEICLLMQHKNIVQTFEHGLTLKGEPFLIMEHIDGFGLNYLIETVSDDLEGQRVHYVVQMAVGLEYIHTQGFLHRDICPRNFMVTKGGVLKYIDFGLAIPNKPEFSKPGNRTGTADYLAPEVIKRMPTDQRVDLFALGVTAYETIVGALPWERTSPEQTLKNHMNIPGRDPREIMPELEEGIAKFLIKAIEREPRDRFQTAQEFREAAAKLPRKY